jgi:hypothetical protein
VLSNRRSRRSRTFIVWSGWRWLASVRFEPSITAATGGSAPAGWAGIERARFGCFAISMVERAAADCKLLAHRQTGVVSRWKSSTGWNWSKVHGTQLPTIPAHRPASRKWMWTLKISLFPWLRRRDSAATARAVGGRWRSATWRWRTGYVARGECADPRGRKSGGGSGADNPTWPARAEGEKRFRSLIRNP